MAQKSITSFFTAQKKKVEAPLETVSSNADSKKCDVAGKSTPPSSPPSKPAKEKEVAEAATSPVAAVTKKKIKRIVVSSDEEENVSPSNEKSSDESRSPSPEETNTKPVRKKVKRGAAALREIESKRAAKKARLASLDTSTVTEGVEIGKEAKAAEESMELAEEAAESAEEGEEKDAADSPKKSPQKKNSPAKSPEKSPAKSPTKSAPKSTDKKTESAIVTSDFSDEEDASAHVASPPAKKGAKGKGKAKAAPKKKSPAVSKKPPAAKKTAAATKKSPEAPAKTTSESQPKKPTGQSMASFFAPKPKKDEDGSSDAAKNKDATKSDYNPNKPHQKYHPIDDASWQKGKPVPYLALARTLECIEETSARLKITEILSNFFRSVTVLSPDNLLPCVYLCLNKLAPAFEGLELGLAERSLMKAVAQSSGRSEKQVMEEVDSAGDVGIVAQNSCGRQAKLFRPPPLLVPTVFGNLKTIAAMKGRDSMTHKLHKVVAMYNACQPIEARYLIRSLAGKLRIGLAEQTVLQALAQACTSTPPNQTEYPPPILNGAQGMSAESFKAKVDEQALTLKTTYCECPVYDKVLPIMLEHGIKGLPKHCQISPGVPLRPMLAHPTKGVADVLARFDGRRFTCEWKYDGERAQIHISERGASVRIFSRNQEDNTSKYPDLVSRLSTQLAEDVNECILDCETVAWDREANRIMPFQVLSTRKKKDANEEDIKVQVCLFVFDLLYVNGEALVRVPLEERRRKLKEVVKEVPGQLQLAESLDTACLEEVQAYLELAVKGNCEGLMVKTLEEEATYEIAKRSRNWLKLKKDYLEGVGDTLDLVVLGGYLGRGKRTGGYGGFLLGCYDPETEEYQSICKIGTGFSDEDLQTHSEFFKDKVLTSGPRPYYRFDPTLAPDHWFDAVQVWEVKCADLSLSPVHKAAIGIVDSEKGISLRFPRFLRIRDDKKVEEATSASQVAEMYQNQDQVKNQADSSKAATEDDFY